MARRQRRRHADRRQICGQQRRKSRRRSAGERSDGTGKGDAVWARDEGAREARRARGGGLTRVHQRVAIPPESLGLSLSEPDTLEASLKAEATQTDADSQSVYSQRFPFSASSFLAEPGWIPYIVYFPYSP